jgi:cytochrome c oxidase subunit 3
VFLLSTLALGILFVVLQFVGFGQIVSNGYYFTGSESSINILYIVTIVHLMHLAGGLISLLIIIYNHFKQNTTRVKLWYRTVGNVLALLDFFGFI